MQGLTACIDVSAAWLWCAPWLVPGMFDFVILALASRLFLSGYLVDLVLAFC
jgi:hypothetical protein